ncbi:hypothetical protein Tco_0272301, partial [Tanacetum coccineum]
YALWEVIEFGDSYKAPPEETGKGVTGEGSAKKKGRTVWMIGKSEVSIVQGVSTSGVQVSTASTDVATASLSHDTVCEC